MIKFNSADSIENSYLSRGISCIKFTVENRLKNTTRSKKPIAMDSRIDIYPVSTKLFLDSKKKIQKLSLDTMYQYKQL